MSADQQEELHIDPEFFVQTALQFECFSDANKVKNKDELFTIITEAHANDTLTEAQDHVIELIMHLISEEVPFNLNRALQVWDESDINSFTTIIKEQSK